jgi:5,10-methylenetetrahydromethanopterin reductase
MAEPFRVHLRVPATAPMAEVVAQIQGAEAAGFDGAGVLDSQLLTRDTFVVLACAAGETTRIRLFPAVTNPFTRHVSVLASAVATVEDLAPDRLAVVIGSGYTSASTIGRKPATLAEMREAITTLRTLLAGDAVDFAGTRGRLPYASGRRIPILMAASGPKAIELAGEIADGAMLMIGFHPGIVERALEHLERGARRSGRSLDDLEVVFAVRTGVADTIADARRLARPVVVHAALLAPGGPWLEAAGLRLPRFEIPAAVHAIRPDLSHARDWNAAIEATAFVPDDVVGELCDALGLFGTAEHCADRLVALAREGVRGLYLMGLETYAGADREVRAFRDVVFPRLAREGLR